MIAYPNGFVAGLLSAPRSRRDLRSIAADLRQMNSNLRRSVPPRQSVEHKYLATFAFSFKVFNSANTSFSRTE
jgi:hypothetical protein